MNMYTHYLLARRLEGLLQPEDPAEYAWGAVIPDIRYLAGMRRSQTHVEIAQVKSWLECYPARRSFGLGYLVHCLLDQIDVGGVLESTFPMSALRLIRRKKLSPQQAAMLVEYYYVSGNREPCTGKSVEISGTYNEILAGLGLQPEQIDVYAAALRDYLGQPTLENFVGLARRLGFVDDSRFERYLGAAKSLQKNRLLLLPLMWSVNNARFESRGAKLILHYNYPHA
jgi:hypothetical protein